MNVNKLKGKIVENSLTIPKFAKLVNIERSAMYRKLNDMERIRIGEAVRMKEVLNLSNDEACEIFLS